MNSRSAQMQRELEEQVRDAKRRLREVADEQRAARLARRDADRSPVGAVIEAARRNPAAAASVAFAVVSLIGPVRAVRLAARAAAFISAAGAASKRLR